MKKAMARLDRVIILCRDIEKTTGLYSAGLGLKVYLQSPDLVELWDSNNLKIFLKRSSHPPYLSKGYSPMLSFKIQESQEGGQFERIHGVLTKYYDLATDGEIVETERGKMCTLMGLDGETICIHNLKESELETQDQAQAQDSSDQFSQKEISRLLQKIKL